ncbi:unnamed protein product [Mytilus edulis]|uniref:Multiple epidermal growth factor-like domains 10 n=1 Tax=Mytilus edulis TaxID=6550 RepID=A0A8S3RFQ7_MYTED|nr:unnamed protein product [Mytilus edulis]
MYHSTLECNYQMHVNLAPQGLALQSSNYPNYPANLAIEEPANNKWIGGCSVTATGQTYSWWGLQLPAVAFMTNILIYYRENFAHRMDEFSLYLGNGTADQSSDSGLCYTDKGKPGYPDITQNITCNMLAKNLYFVNRRSDATCYIELCYVAIYGCWKGTWGTNCATICPDGCIDRHCFPQNGSCVWGCDIQRCVHGVCDPKTAVCIKGCVPGLGRRYCTLYENPPIGIHRVYCSNTTDSWVNGIVLYDAEYYNSDTEVFAVCKYIIYLPPILYGNSKIDICEIEIGGCPNGKYGDSCRLTCSENCMGPCDLISGKCVFGCSSGWLSAKCDTACEVGKFGDQCQRDCSVNCISPPCDHVTGQCKSGCLTGWEGFNCTEECSKGKFSWNCTETCDGCIVNECNHINGICKIDSVCKPGYKYGKYCNEMCNDWHYGTNCKKMCNCLKIPCNIFTGECSDDGCKKGWEGDSCDQECGYGYFGFNCAYVCETCFNQSCDIFEGNCRVGCNDGYRGRKCETQGNLQS